MPRSALRSTGAACQFPLERWYVRPRRLSAPGDLGLFRLERCLRGLQFGRQDFGFLHALEQPILVLADALLGDADLRLHRLVFLVGLDLHQLAFELAEASLNGGELLFDLAAGCLAGGDRAP